MATVGQFQIPTDVNVMNRPTYQARRPYRSRPHGFAHPYRMNTSRPPTHQTLSSSTPIITESKEKVEKALAEIIAHYSSQNEYVSVDKVVEKLFTSYKVTDWSDLYIINVKNPYEHLKPLSNLVIRHASLYLFLEVYKQIRVIGTLYELKQEILEHFGVDSYDKLNLGPFLKHPKIKNIIYLHDDASTIRETDTIEIIESFYKFTRTLKYNERADFDAFKDQAAKDLGEETWSHLGVYVTSFPYLLQVNKIFLFIINNETGTIILYINS